MTVSRRTFLKSTAATAAASMATAPVFSAIAKQSTTLAMVPGPGNKWPGRVAINFDKGAVNGLNVDQKVVNQMVDDNIMVLTGEKSVGAAWKAIFPSSLSAQSKIAIKTNILNAGVAPHPYSVQAIVAGLVKTNIITAGNITVYDMNNGNIFNGTPSPGQDSAHYESDLFPGTHLVKDSAQAFGDGAINNRAYSKTLNAADFLINIFSPRGHSVGSSFTIGFKSHYGTYANPAGMHGNNAAENQRDINCTGPVFQKNVLSVCSGIFGMNEGHGPGGAADLYRNYVTSVDPTATAQSNPCTIIMSTDPISCDMQAIKMIRLNKNPAGNYGIGDMPTYLRAAAGVAGALPGTTYNIGEIDETKMDVRKIINGEGAITGVAGKSTGGVLAASEPLLDCVPLKQGICFIEYRVSQVQIGASAKIEIVDLRGSTVFATTHAVSGARNHFSWNQITTQGSRAARGNYIVRVTAGTLYLSGKVTLS